MLMLAFVFVLNLLISAWNAHAVGWSWVEAKAAGGWMRILAWSGAIMSACGFTWCYLVIATLVAQATEYLKPDDALMVFKLGYLVIILPVLGSGLAIWAESVATAWRERTLRSVGFAGYNTFAQFYNTYQAMKAVPEIFGDVTEFFSNSSSDEARANIAKVVLMMAALAVLGGIITTASIIRLSARSSARQILASHRTVQA